MPGDAHRADVGPLVVVLADGERQGTAVAVEVGVPDRIVGRVRLGYQPVIAVDARNRQLVAICSPVDSSRPTALVAYALDDLAVRWRVSLDERIHTKVVAWPSVLPSVDGRYVFTYHYRMLLPGDANAPGATRYWIGVRDARTGALLREVDTPECGVGTFHQATPDLLYVECAHRLHAIRTDTWQEARSFVIRVATRLSALTASADRYVVVTQGQSVVTFDTSTGDEVSRSWWSDAAMPTVPFFDRLAMAPDGSEVWVPVAAPGNEFRPGHAVAHIDLVAGRRIEHPVAALGAVARVHDRVLYVDAGRLGSLGSTAQLDLGVSHRVVAWRIVAGPSQ